MSKVISIKSHPRYRDVAALRRYLAEGQDDFGTPVHISHILDLKAPELQEQLSELNAWAEALQGLTPISMTDPNAMPMGPNDEIAVNFDFSHYRGLNLSHGPNVGKSIPVNPYDVLRQGVNIVIQNKMQYMVKESTDANPST